MSLALIPAAVLLVVLVISGSGEPSKDVPPKPRYSSTVYKKQPPKKTAVQKKPVPKHVVSNVHKPQDNADENLEYTTIFTYIKSKYKQIQDEDAKKISEFLVQYGKKHQVDPKFAAAVIARESAFNKAAVSQTGAKGLGQIKDFNFSSLKIENPFDIEQNVGGTTAYLKEMLSNWDKRMKKAPEYQQAGKKVPLDETEKIKLALASYYKGFTAVNREGVDSKTEGYVDDILKYYNELVTLRAQNASGSKK